MLVYFCQFFQSTLSGELLYLFQIYFICSTVEDDIIVDQVESPEIVDDFELDQDEATEIKDKEVNKQKLRRRIGQHKACFLI